MSEFSQPAGSSFPNQNVLFDPLMAGRQQAQTEPTADAGPADRSDCGGPRAGRASCGWAAERAGPGEARGRCMRAGWGCCSRRAWPSTRRRRCRTRARCGRWSARPSRPQTQAEWLQNLTANKAYTSAGNTASYGSAWEHHRGRSAILRAHPCPRHWWAWSGRLGADRSGCRISRRRRRRPASRWTC